MPLTLAVNTVSVQADALDYLGNTIDGSELTNEMESIGNYQSVARSTYLHQGFVRITNNGNGYIGIVEQSVMLHVNCKIKYLFETF